MTSWLSASPSSFVVGRPSSFLAASYLEDDWTLTLRRFGGGVDDVERSGFFRSGGAFTLSTLGRTFFVEDAVGLQASRDWNISSCGNISNDMDMTLQVTHLEPISSMFQEDTVCFASA